MWDTKSLAQQNVKKMDDESEKAFKSRLLQERYRLYMEKFKEYPCLHISKSNFFVIEMNLLTI